MYCNSRVSQESKMSPPQRERPVPAKRAALWPGSPPEEDHPWVDVLKAAVQRLNRGGSIDGD